jgi:hypothetical protein
MANTSLQNTEAHHDYMQYNAPLIELAEDLIAAIRGIVDNWEHGDLAAAVNHARELADTAADAISNNCAEG